MVVVVVDPVGAVVDPDGRVEDASDPAP